MKGMLFAAALVLAAVPVLAQDASGTWKTQTNERGAYLHVRIGPCGDDNAQTCGVITEAVNATRTDLVSKPIIWGMQPDGSGKWAKGTIWAPDDDKTYRSRMRLDGNTLRVEGCVAVFCRGQDWTRVN